MTPLPACEIPKGEVITCDECAGRGTEHDCPDCNCDCALCDGTGEITEAISVTVRGAIYNTVYIRRIMDLPGLLFSTNPPQVDAARFTFDGGEGLIMPMRSRAHRHVDLNEPS
jgi:hypothetical protein